MILPLLELLDAEFSSVGSEYFINSQELEDRVRQLLPSQGGAGAGFDLSASTQIIPIIDLTESASGSNLREDLQKALSFNSVTSFDVINTTTTLITNTGYYRVFGVATGLQDTVTSNSAFTLNDGTSDKVIWNSKLHTTTPRGLFSTAFDFIVFLGAGDSLKCTATIFSYLVGCTRQIATIDGVLVNPT